MNYFFFASAAELTSRLQIPRFQNSGNMVPHYKLFSARIDECQWRIENVQCDLDGEFYILDSTERTCDHIFFLASENEVGGLKITAKSLVDYNDFSETAPHFRANLSVSNESGGFSSYQAEYPYSMVGRKGSLVSSVATLVDSRASINRLFIRNIYHEPIVESYPGYLVCKQSKVIKKQVTCWSNKTNVINLSAGDVDADTYFVANGFLGVPMYCCQSADGHLSFEHTHPPHENLTGPKCYAMAARMRNELLEIVS